MSNEFLKAVNDFVEPIKPELVFRVYYDGSGRITAGTTEELPGNYIEVPKAEYESLRISQARVVDGKLKKIDFSIKNVLHLQSDESGEFVTMPNDMMIVATTGDRYSIKKHE